MHDVEGALHLLVVAGRHDPEPDVPRPVGAPDGAGLLDPEPLVERRGGAPDLVALDDPQRRRVGRLDEPGPSGVELDGDVPGGGAVAYLP
jgi:hypothetical protein